MIHESPLHNLIYEITNIFNCAIFITPTLTLKSQDLSSFELRAHYPLSADGVDHTGNYDPIEFEKPVFSFGGILSRGC